MCKDGLGVSYIDGTLKLPSGKALDMNSVNIIAKWTNLYRVAMHWIATVELDCVAISTSEANLRQFKSSLKIPMTPKINV